MFDGGNVQWTISNSSAAENYVCLHFTINSMHVYVNMHIYVGIYMNV